MLQRDVKLKPETGEAEGGLATKMGEESPEPL